ncbi:c-type cytochrome [Alcaligenes sp. SDU_A2]|uniref:c-type cytochrome n=1 Tax=Alcaligenes sp. SDU_A2 TaxID=3136634 RepID=UPI00311F71CB
MSIMTRTCLAVVLATVCVGAGAQQAHVYGFGVPATEAELAKFVSPLPDGRGLPKGSGTVEQGQKLYTQHCMACHGAKLEGGIGDRLIGGRGTLAAGKGPPVKTVESYWPYATTLFDYTKRAMPFTAPGSLSNDEVYALTAYILSQAGAIQPDQVMDQTSLPQVKMLNRDGFKPAGR